MGTTGTVRLAKLGIEEVSGVDDPANTLPGFMVAKAKNPDKPYGDVTYADPGYQEDGKNRYPLDTEKHVRAAWSYINQEKNQGAYTTEQLGKVKGAITAAAKKLDIEISDAQKSSTPSSEWDDATRTWVESGDPADSPQGALAIVGKIRELVRRTGKEEVDMTKEELTEALAADRENLVKSLVEAIAEATKPAPVEKADEGEATPEAKTETAPALDAEALTKAVEDAIEAALQPVLEVVDKALDQIDTLSGVVSGSTRKSLEGQEANEGDEGEPEAPKLGDAIAKALNRS